MRSKDAARLPEGLPTYCGYTHYGYTCYGSTHYGSTHYGSTHNGSTYYSSTHYGSTYYGSTHYGSTYYGSSHYGSAHYGSTYYGSTHCGSTYYGSTHCGSTYYGSTYYGCTLCGSAHYGQVRHGGVSGFSEEFNIIPLGPHRTRVLLRQRFPKGPILSTMLGVPGFSPLLTYLVRSWNYQIGVEDYSVMQGQAHNINDLGAPNYGQLGTGDDLIVRSDDVTWLSPLRPHRQVLGVEA